MLGEFGVSDDRIEQIVGMADRDPIEPNDPLAAANRRISIVLLRESSGSSGSTDQNVAEQAPTATETTLPSIRAQTDSNKRIKADKSGG